MHRLPAAVPALRHGRFRCIAAATVLLALGAHAAAPARAEEPTRVTADADVPPADRDRALMAEIGLDIAKIEQADDVALLWRAVRALVLPHRVSTATQQRILRRAWLADPVLRGASHSDAPYN